MPSSPDPARPSSSRPRRRSGRPSEAPRAAAPATPAAPAAAAAPAGPLPAPAAGDALGFAALGVPPVLVAALAREGIASPFPIQVATLPDTLAGRDVLGRGRTGSGKTLAFSLPLVARLVGGRRAPKRPRALVLVPTRELANQVLAVVAPLAQAAGLTSTVVFGGVGQNPQVKALAPGVDVLIACPGRLEDLIGQGFCDLSAVEITVLDEADHMADLGFLPAVKRLLDRTPAQGQRMLFSATLDNGVDVLVKRYLHQPDDALRRPGRRAGVDDDPPRLQRQRGRQGRRRAPARVRSGPQPAVHADQAHRQEAGQAADRRRHPRRRAARQPQPGRPRAQPVRVHRRQHPGPRGHRHRGPRHPRRRRRARRARRPADRAQGVPAPLRPHRPRRRRRHGRHPGDARPDGGGAHPGQAGRHPPDDARRAPRRRRDRRAHRPAGAVRRAGCRSSPSSRARRGQPGAAGGGVEAARRRRPRPGAAAHRARRPVPRGPAPSSRPARVRRPAARRARTR